VIDLDIGKKIKNLRKKKGLTLQELSQRSGVSPGYISMLERGFKKSPTLDVLKKLAKGLEVNLSELIGEELVNLEKDERTKLLLRAANELSKLDLESLEQLLRAIRELKKKEDE